MSLTPNPKNQPAPDGNQPINVRPGSALAVIGVFLEVIRKRFTAENKLPWVWHSDIKNKPSHAAAIAIESAFNEDKDHRDFRPAIYVDRDELIVGRTVIGDAAGQNLRNGLKGFWALTSLPILIECVAAKKGESAIIGDLTAVFLHASSDLIQSAFGFHEMTPPAMGRTQPYPRDKDQWVTSISFSVQYDFRWTNKPTAALLQQIIMEVAASDHDSATSYFETIALTGTSDVNE